MSECIKLCIVLGVIKTLEHLNEPRVRCICMHVDGLTGSQHTTILNMNNQKSRRYFMVTLRLMFAVRTVLELMHNICFLLFSQPKSL